MARQPKGICPTCGKKGLGHVFPAGGGKSYRQCTYCNATVDVPAHAIPLDISTQAEG